MARQFRGYDLREWLLGVGVLALLGLWLLLAAVVAASFYARESMLDAVGAPGMVALTIGYLLPLVGVYLHADRVRATLRERY